MKPTNKDIQFPQQNWVRKRPRLIFLQTNQLTP